MRQRIDPALLARLSRDAAQTSQRIDAVDVHSTTTANPLSAGPAKRQRRIQLILDADQRVQHHRPRLVQVELKLLHLGLGGRFIWVPAIDAEGLHASVGGGSHCAFGH